MRAILGTLKGRDAWGGGDVTGGGGRADSKLFRQVHVLPCLSAPLSRRR